MYEELRLQTVYAAALAPLGARRLETMVGDGLPPRLVAPLRFLFGGRVPAEAADSARTIERLRKDLASRPEHYRFAYRDSPLGTVRWLEHDAGAEGRHTPRAFATGASVPRRWGLFLRLCVDAFEARTVLEMGAGLGISGAYMASARSHPHFVTLEGSPVFAPIARATLAAVSDRAEVVTGAFHETLVPTLARLGTLDVAYIDGHHEEAATLHYMQTIAPHLADEALVIFDDIYLYRGMWQAWQTLAAMRGVRAAVNVGRFGLLAMQRMEATAPRYYDLARYTGRWRVGGAREIST